MSHLPFTLAAYFLNAVAVTIDKILLNKAIKDPLTYIFYFSIFSLLALLLLPFAHFPPLFVLFLASLSTILWTTGAYFMLKALQKGQVARVIPVIGTLTPVILLIQATTSQTITTNQLWAVVILIFGLIFITLPSWRGDIKREEILFEFIASFFFAVSYLVLRQAYLQEDFLTVFVYSRMVLIPAAAIIFLVPTLRKRAFSQGDTKFNLLSSSGVLFLLGQSAGGASELLLTFSISLATPALVNSLQGIQYAFLFIFSLVLSNRLPKVFKEDFSLYNMYSKLAGIIFLALGLYVLAFSGQIGKKADLGVTFSPRYAQSLGLNPKALFNQMLLDLDLKYVRLPVYWDEVEKQPGIYDFSKTDYYLSQAQAKNVKVILVLGNKVPRWPECFMPKWSKGLSGTQYDQKILELVSTEVNHFKGNGLITTWQVENEPLFNFGLCPKVDNQTRQLLKQEVAAVKNLDSRPVLLTDSGELSSWVTSIKMSDIFGLSLYRTVWNPLFGVVDYPLPPFFYTLKNNFVHFLTGTKQNRDIISELQAEPWPPNKLSLTEVDLEQQIKLFPTKKLIENGQFARETEFSSIYFWGVEWWYFMAKHNHPEYLETAKEIFRQP